MEINLLHSLKNSTDKNQSDKILRTHTTATDSCGVREPMCETTN